MTDVPARDLAGRVALVTGAGRRLGRAIALRLADAGAAVALHAHASLEEARETARAIQGSGGRACALSADLGQPEAAEDVVAQAEGQLGRLDLLVNNAGHFEATALAEEPLANVARAFDRLLALNARAPLLLALAFARRLGESAGCVINVACTSGLSPWSGFVPYSASKGALLNLTRGLAKALGPHVRVNAVAPGPVLPPASASEAERARIARTTLLGRWGEPADVAEAVLLLATAEYVTGVVLPVDGGRTLR